jgi:hypothetical protein
LASIVLESAKKKEKTKGEKKKEKTKGVEEGNVKKPGAEGQCIPDTIALNTLSCLVFPGVSVRSLSLAFSLSRASPARASGHVSHR